MSFDERDLTYVLSVKGLSREDCITKVQEKHGRNYQIQGWENIKIRSGLLGLRSQPGYQLNYVVTRVPNVYSSTAPFLAGMDNRGFEEEKRKILEKSGKATDAKLDLLTDAVKQIQNALENKITPAAETDHPTIQKIESLLEQNEFSFSYIKKIINRIRQEFPLDALEDFDKVEQTVIRWIGESIQVSKMNLDSFPKIIMLVGPTGIGKTTTVAKLTYQLAYGGNGTDKIHEARIITTDTYKIGAEAQIERYCKILDVEYDKVENNSDFNQVIDYHKNSVDLFIVDTSGYSPKDSGNIGKMKQIVDSKKFKEEVFLCMQAATKMSDMMDIMQQYEPFSYTALIITKLDETTHIGNIISALAEKNKSIAYITDGQKVPICIEEASVSRLLVELTGFNVDSQKVQEVFGPIGNGKR